MGNTFEIELAAITKQIHRAAISTGCKHTAVWCVTQLPTLYAQFRETNESRYGEEITRLVQGMLTELATGEKSCLKARELAAKISDRLQLLHEQFGLPAMRLHHLAVAPARPRAVGVK